MCLLEDLRSIRFQLFRFDVHDEAVGLQLAFPISACGNESREDLFAEVSLEVKGTLVETLRLPREVHANAGKVLLVSGYSKEFEQSVFPRHSRKSSASRVSAVRFRHVAVNTIRCFWISRVTSVSVPERPPSNKRMQQGREANHTDQ